MPRVIDRPGVDGESALNADSSAAPATDTRFSGKRILITGARGFLGTHLWQALAATGAELHGVVRTLPPETSSGHIRWWQSDVSDASTMERVIQAVRPDIVYHLTSHAWGAPDLDKVLPTLRDDLVATVNVLTACVRAQVDRVITTGSSQEPEIVNGQCIPCSPYAAAKVAGGAYARMFHEVFGLRVVVVRPFMVYGPGQSPGKVIPYMIRSLLAGESPKLGQASHAVDWIYVDDAVRGLIEAAVVGGIEGQTLDLGSGRAVPLSAVADEIAALLRTTQRPKFGAVSRPLEPSRVADAQATWRKLGWRAEVSMREGLRRTVAYWRAAASPAHPGSQSRLLGGLGAPLLSLGDFAQHGALAMGFL